MAHEIADSDDESDLIAPPRPLTGLELPKVTSDLDPILDLSFDQFLSPTQRLSSYDGKQLAQNHNSCTNESSAGPSAPYAPHSASTIYSSERSQSPMDSRTTMKRSVVQVESDVGGRNDQTLPTKKRLKTYGRSQYQSLEDDFTAVPNEKTLQSNVARPEISDRLTDDETSSVRESIMQNIWSSGFGQSLQDAHKNDPQRISENGVTQTTTVNSSVGGYQSININYSGTGTGFDYNPYGSLSQVSLDEEPNAETEKVVSLFRNSSNHGRNTLALPLSRENLNAEGFENADSSDRRDDNNKEEPGIYAIAVPNNDEALQPISQTTETPSRKRRVRSLDPTFNISAILGEHTDEVTDQRKCCESEIAETVSEVRKKDLSSDLGLDDPSVIGLPAENYVPRPTRRRAKQERLSTGVAYQPEQEGFTPMDYSVESTNNPKGKRGKKGKGKKADTFNSTSAPLDLQTHNSEEREEVKEVSLTEEIPRNVKLEMSQSPSQRNKNEKDEPDIVAEYSPLSDCDVATTRTGTMSPPRSKKVSVDVPPLRKSATQPHPMTTDAVPKRKGRRKKKEVKIDEDPKPDDDAYTKQQETDPQRHALESKDPNLLPESNSTSHDELDKPKDADENDCLTRQEPTLPVKDDSRTSIDLSNKSLKFGSEKYRIGLSRRHFIPSLLRKVDRDKEPPKVSEKKEKLTKKQMEQREKEKLEREDGADDSGVKERGVDGFLLEWDD